MTPAGWAFVLSLAFTAAAVGVAVGFVAYWEGWRRGRREERDLWFRRLETGTPPRVLPPPEPWPNPRRP